MEFKMFFFKWFKFKHDGLKSFKTIWNIFILFKSFPFEAFGPLKIFHSFFYISYIFNFWNKILFFGNFLDLKMLRTFETICNFVFVRSLDISKYLGFRIENHFKMCSFALTIATVNKFCACFGHNGLKHSRMHKSIY